MAEGKAGAPFGRFAMMSAHMLEIDPAYQRSIKPSHLANLVKNFDTDLFDPIAVAERNRRFYVIDGQHRLEAAKLRGIKIVPCMVWQSQGLEDEAANFLSRNKGRKPIAPIEAHKAAVLSRDTTACEIQNMLDSVGLHLTNSHGAWPGFQAIATAYTIYRVGPELLHDVLEIGAKLAENGASALDMQTMQAMVIVHRCVDLPAPLRTGNVKNAILNAGIHAIKNQCQIAMVKEIGVKGANRPLETHAVIPELLKLLNKFARPKLKLKAKPTNE